MTKWITIILCCFFVSCGLFEEEPVTIVSEIDGKEYLADMQGEMNARKAARLILEGKKDSVSYLMNLAISDSLESTDSVWRDRYFKALNQVLPQLDSSDVVYVAANAFVYFLHYPDELLHHLNHEAFDNSDYWINMLAHEYRQKTEPEDITINSVINRAHKYCSHCSDDTMQLIVQYIEMLDTYNEPLMYNEEIIPSSIL